MSSRDLFLTWLLIKLLPLIQSYLFLEFFLFFFFENAQEKLWFVNMLIQIYHGIVYHPIMALAWWLYIFWLLLVDLKLSLGLFKRKRGIWGHKNRNSVPRHTQQKNILNNEVPIYAYADYLNIFSCYHLKGWHASIFGGNIFYEDIMDSVGVMDKSSWQNHLMLSNPYY